ncbi:MAG: TPM domain-containing protein [Candidatus Cloacimonetes bacterium]|nr:TPM domain-containing protein [Candidatus Cloacimonadota bacterium]MBL7149107.1 TPM domain-containing protein [Candidatus Cloacimonadota bacterium]
MKSISWRNNMKRTIIFTLILISSLLVALEVPRLKSMVNDYGDVLSSREEMQLEQLLRDAQAKTSSQIVLLTIKSLQNENLEDYSLRVADKWKLGQKELDNGVLLLVAMQEKKIRIEVGYGLESVLTDIKCGYIIRNFIVPEFKKGNFSQGIANGLLAVTGLITNEFEITEEQLAKYQQQQKKGNNSQLPIGFIVFIIMMILMSFGRRGRGGLFTALFLGSMLSGGRGGRSSGFGGGFGGFSGGGGGFGGGGASGGW